MANVSQILPQQQPAAVSPTITERFTAGALNILHSHKASAVFSAFIGGGVAAATNSLAGLFGATTAYLLTETFRLNVTDAVKSEWVEKAKESLVNAGVYVTDLNARMKDLQDKNAEMTTQLLSVLKKYTEKEVNPAAEGMSAVIVPAVAVGVPVFGPLPESATVVEAVLSETGEEGFEPGEAPVFPTLH